jgi:hypothetical protein
MKSSEISAEQFHILFQRWVAVDTLAIRWNKKRTAASKNWRRRKLSARRSSYWGNTSQKFERNIMDLFHAFLKTINAVRV